MVNYTAKSRSGGGGSARNYDMYNAAQSEFWKQKTVREDASAAERRTQLYPAPPEEPRFSASVQGRAVLPYSAAMRPGTAGQPLGRRWPAPTTANARRAFRPHSAPRTVYGKGRGGSGEWASGSVWTSDDGWTPPCWPSQKPQALSKEEMEYDLDHDGRLDLAERAIMRHHIGKSGKAAAAATRTPRPRPHTARPAPSRRSSAHVSAVAGRPSSARPTSARVVQTTELVREMLRGADEVLPNKISSASVYAGQVQPPAAGIDIRPAYSDLVVDVRTKAFRPDLGDDASSERPEPTWTTPRVEPTARCQPCGEAGRSTAASFTEYGQKVAKWCGICAAKAPVPRSHLVRVEQCTSCRCFLGTSPSSLPPKKPGVARLCQRCAADRCVPAYQPLEFTPAAHGVASTGVDAVQPQPPGPTWNEGTPNKAAARGGIPATRDPARGRPQKERLQSVAQSVCVNTRSMPLSPRVLRTICRCG